ncbi:alpha/beta hydrolase family protein [Flavobacterium sp. PL02]|uniref:alpha/beta hydrolase family protein n=1 Tax=Flavobacterium sp. PL02 TaxID=3088354 RepID=UPI002B23AA3B|nr:prolyl oligopeptidase family serine peptidase [Flavobacterium sp. PL02]MEA9414306.1 prolyl oligopeptidase family serine peptidase [Flavobacterium sp. PL02]
MVFIQVKGQSIQKKTLTEKDYHLWGTLRNEKISPNGSWASFAMQYDSGEDTLFVKNTRTNKRYSFPKGYSGTFGSDNWYACKIPGDTLSIVNLAKGIIQHVPQTTEYHFSGNKKFIASFFKSGDNGYLILRDMYGKEIMRVNEVLAWKVSPCANFIACVTSKEVIILKLGKTIEPIKAINSSESSFYNIEWDEISTGLTLLSKANTSTTSLQQNKNIHYFRLSDKRLFTLSSNAIVPASVDWEFTPIKPAVSPNGKYIYIPMHIPAEQLKPEVVEVWNTADDYIHTSSIRSSKRPQKKSIFVWLPETSKIIPLTERIDTSILLSSDMEKILIAEPVLPLKYNTLVPNNNYFVKDLQSGKKTLILKDFPGHARSVTESSTGRYFTYFLDGNWWVYDSKQCRHKMISGEIKVPLSNVNDNAGSIGEYGIAGWTAEDSHILIYDKFDIYKVATDGSSSQRLTKGREKNIIYRIVRNSKKWQQAYIGNEEIYNLDKGFVILAKELNHTTSGYFLWTSNGIKEIISGYYKYSEFQQSANGKMITVMEQDVATPPRLIKIQENNHKEKLFQSNTHFKNYNWSSSDQIQYKGANGQNLSGVLYYPAEYNPQKKYPMIINIYETMGWTRHQYWKPTLLNEAGFNAANLTAKGYFVLFPDIEYVLGEPGESALKCVLASIDSALQKANIDKTKIGLIGHSFGGYESSYIATHTNLFATVVSGAGFMDFTKYYLSISGNHKIPEYWRSENSQQRMKVTPFEDWAKYDRNSPLRASKNLSMPILTYIGAKDTQVNPDQSLEFWLALKRLGKENIMLVYPDENHVFEDPKNQADLTQKIEQWFGYYLKDEAYPEWAKPYQSN